jgi:uncharacterized protein (DUF433 family)
MAQVETLELNGAVVSRPGLLGGELCFAHSRVPVRSLFDHLEEGYTLDQFLASFPSVTRERAIAVMHQAGNLLVASTCT